MFHRFITYIVIAAIAMPLMGQIVNPDSICENYYSVGDTTEMVNRDSIVDFVKPFSIANDEYFSIATTFYLTTKYDHFPYMTTSAVHITPLFIYPSPTFPMVIHNGDNYSIFGSVVTNNYPGLMNKDTGAIGMSIGNDKLNLYVGGIVNKYGFYGGLLRQLGVNGRFTYQFSSPWSFTAFAYYYVRNRMPMMPDGSPMPPSMLGYYDVSRFGGYINYSPSERFGIQVGGQVVERMGARNHYEVEPIATPYINVGRGKKKIGIGLPVGQILYGIFGR